MISISLARRCSAVDSYSVLRTPYSHDSHMQRYEMLYCAAFVARESTRVLTVDNSFSCDRFLYKDHPSPKHKAPDRNTKPPGSWR